jgi:hypothetical protein
MRRMLAPLRSDLAVVCSLVVRECKFLEVLRSAVAALRNFYSADAQIGWRRSLNLYGVAAQVDAVLYVQRCFDLHTRWPTHMMSPRG